VHGRASPPLEKSEGPVDVLDLEDDAADAIGVLLQVPVRPSASWRPRCASASELCATSAKSSLSV
jgi:hypothetical protein